MKKTINYHEVEIRFTLSERALPGVLDYGCTPAQKDRLNDPDTPAPVGEILAELFEDALTGNETGSADIEDLRITFDGVLVRAFDGPRR